MGSLLLNTCTGRRGITRLALLCCSLLMVPMAQADTRIRFAADWAFQGPQAPFLLPHANGCYADNDLNVNTTRGFGSGDTITKVSSNAVDVGFADINAMLEFNARHPNDALIAIFMIYDAAPLSIIARKDKGVSSPADLVGKSIAAPPGDASRRLFSLLANANDIDADSINWINVSPEVRESLLARGRTDAIAGHSFTGFIGAKAAGIDEDNLAVLRFSEHGVPLYGSALIARPAFAEANSEGVTAFIGCIAQAFMDSARDPDNAIQVLRRQEPLTDHDVEKERLMLSIDWSVATEDVIENGMSQIDMERLAGTLRETAAILDIPVPEASAVYTDAYLPPHEQLLWSAE